MLVIYVIKIVLKQCGGLNEFSFSTYWKDRLLMSISIQTRKERYRDFTEKTVLDFLNILEFKETDIENMSDISDLMQYSRRGVTQILAPKMSKKIWYVNGDFEASVALAFLFETELPQTIRVSYHSHRPYPHVEVLAEISMKVLSRVYFNDLSAKS